MIGILLKYILWFEFLNDLDAQSDFAKIFVTKKLVKFSHSHLKYALTFKYLKHRSVILPTFWPLCSGIWIYDEIDKCSCKFACRLRDLQQLILEHCKVLSFVHMRIWDFEVGVRSFGYWMTHTSKLTTVSKIQGIHTVLLKNIQIKVRKKGVLTKIWTQVLISK